MPMGRPRQLADKICPICGNKFRPWGAKQVNCSGACYHTKHPKLGIDYTFWRKVEKTATCWLWRGALTKKGYGAAFYDGQNMGAHRAAYLILVGPIPEGKELDHKCRRRNCVNPDHLEPVLHAVNIRRSPFKNGKRICCKHGHPYTPENTRVYKGVKYCKTCERNRHRV